jgi:hypothetical protein
MKVELKNVKIHPDMSAETTCFSASVYIDGKKSGTVENRGCGGSHFYYFDSHEVRKAFQVFCNEQPCEFDFEKDDQYISDLLTRWDTDRWLKRQCKTKIVFKVEGDGEFDWHMLKKKDHPLVIAPYKHFLKIVGEKWNKKITEIANERF